ncbi:unnamed protein product [Caenorhabditis nigoni]
MAASEECNLGIRTEPDLSLDIQKMRAELIAVTVEMKKNQEEIFQKFESKFENNKNSLDKISDRLQSFEAFIPNPGKSEKRFKLKHVFKNVNEFKENEQNFSEKEEHFNANWRIMTARFDDHLGLYVFCEPNDPSDKWSIRTKSEYKVFDRNQDVVIRTSEYCYQENQGWGCPRFQEWEDMKEWFLVDGNLTVEATVTIVETSGLEKERIRKFDESQKDISDVILVVRDTKFYVSKILLAAQSTVFKALLLGNFKESNQSEVTLNGIDPDDFHNFLEVLYGEPAIDDTTVEGVALLADMYDVPNAIRKCEEFLLEKSKKALEKKLEIATCYQLKKLEENCISEIKAIENMQSGVSKETKLDFTKMLIYVVFILDLFLWSFSIFWCLTHDS